jgi:hypothetical protein
MFYDHLYNATVCDKGSCRHDYQNHWISLLERMSYDEVKKIHFNEKTFVCSWCGEEIMKNNVVEQALQIVNDEVANGEFPKDASEERREVHIQAICEWLMSQDKKITH